MESLINIEDYQTEREQIQEENEKFYKKIDKNLNEINKNIKYVLTEQEKQRLNQMTITEVQTEMLRVLGNMKLDLDELLGRDK